MKSLLTFSTILLVANAQNTSAPEEKVAVTPAADVIFDGPTQPSVLMTRDLPADILRDFPGMCFGSTLCRVFNIGESWFLHPFCGEATCVETEGILIERVRDCGVLPKFNPQCKVINDDAVNSTYPSCCPIIQCAKGVVLEYPTEEELQNTTHQSPALSTPKTPAN